MSEPTRQQMEKAYRIMNKIPEPVKYWTPAAKSVLIKANPDGSYNVPVSKDKQKHYRWMPPKPLGTAIRQQFGLSPKALIGYK